MSRPKLMIWAVRASLLYLALGITFGSLLLFHKGIPYAPGAWRLLPAHMDLVLLGAMTQFVFAIAFGIFPRFRTEPRRGNEKLAWGALILLNLGVWMTAFSPYSGLWAGNLLLAGRVLEAAGVLAFLIHAWPRVREVVIILREKAPDQGEAQ